MEQEKKPFYKKWWVWVGGIFLLFAVIGMADTGNNITPPTNNTLYENTSPEQVNESPSISKQYQEVFTFSGNGQKKSEPFNIQGDRFKISYECAGDPSMTLCQAFIYKVGSQLPQGVMNSPEPVSDETIIYTSFAGKGEYYIDANILGNFTMKVYDYR